MARPVTEIVKASLKAGIDVDDANSPAGKVLNKTFNTLMQQDGFQRLHNGLQVENQNWNSIDSHKKFRSQPHYALFAKHMMSILDGPMDVYHANLTVHPPSSSLNPDAASVVEVVGQYFSTGLSDSDKLSFESNLDQFAKVLEDEARGYRGFLGGWVVEELDHPEVEGKAKLWQSVIGWESVEAHMTFRETEAFKSNVHLMQPDSNKAWTMQHFRFKTI
ncbi:MAG: hypothetical protein Q9184_000711 [Pyrenodesmia sp. 2 TL-2023]